MSDITTVFLLVIAFITIPGWLFMFYKKITAEVHEQSIPYRLKPMVKLMPFIAAITVAIALLLAIFDVFVRVAPFFFLASLVAVGLQVLFILVALISKTARHKAINSTEGKFMVVLALLTWAAIKFSWQTFRYVLKLHAKSKSASGRDYQDRSVFGYHGHESEAQKARRLFGQYYE